MSDSIEPRGRRVYTHSLSDNWHSPSASGFADLVGKKIFPSFFPVLFISIRKLGERLISCHKEPPQKKSK